MLLALRGPAAQLRQLAARAQQEGPAVPGWLQELQGPAEQRPQRLPRQRAALQPGAAAAGAALQAKQGPWVQAAGEALQQLLQWQPQAAEAALHQQGAAAAWPQTAAAGAQRPWLLAAAQQGQRGQLREPREHPWHLHLHQPHQR